MRTCGASDNKNEEIEEGVGRSLVFQFVARKDSCDYMKKKKYLKKYFFFK